MLCLRSAVPLPSFYQTAPGAVGFDFVVIETTAATAKINTNTCLILVYSCGVSHCFHAFRE